MIDSEADSGESSRVEVDAVGNLWLHAGVKKAPAKRSIKTEGPVAMKSGRAGERSVRKGDSGQFIEMVRHASDGRIISRETFVADPAPRKDPIRGPVASPAVKFVYDGEDIEEVNRVSRALNRQNMK